MADLQQELETLGIDPATIDWENMPEEDVLEMEKLAGLSKPDPQAGAFEDDVETEYDLPSGRKSPRLDGTGEEPPIKTPAAQIKASPSGLKGYIDWLRRELDPRVPPAERATSIGELEQVPGPKKALANVLELGGGLGGAAAGTVTGEAIGGPAGAYLGGSVVGALGYRGGAGLAESFGLRPEGTYRALATPESMGRDVVTGLVAPPIVQAGAGALKTVAGRASNEVYRTVVQPLATFLNKKLNLARAFSTKLGDYDRVLSEELDRVPELFSREEASRLGPQLGSEITEIAERNLVLNPFSKERGTENVFRSVSSNVGKVKKFWGQKLGEIYEKVPQKIQVKELGLEELNQELTGEGTEVATRAARQIFNKEMDNFRRRFLSEDEYLSYQSKTAKLASAKQELADLNTSGSEIPSELEEEIADLMAIVRLYDSKVLNSKLSATQVREFKTEWANNARYDRRTTGDNFDVTHAGIYGKLAGKLRDFLDNRILSSNLSEEEKKLFVTANDKYSILANFQGIAKDAARSASVGGEAYRTGAFTAQEQIPLTSSIPFVGGLLGESARKVYPEMNVPLARLERGLGQIPRPLTTTVRGIGDVLVTGGKQLEAAARGVQRSATPFSRLGGNPRSRLAQSSAGIITGTGGVQSPVVNPEELGRAIEGLKRYVIPAPVQSVKDFASPGQAQGLPSTTLYGQENPFVEGLPRDTVRFNDQALAKFALDTATTPGAQIAQGLVSKFVETQRSGDSKKLERIVSDMALVFPQFFEPGMGVNNKLFHKDQQEEYMMELERAERDGIVDSIFLGKQRNAFMDPNDSRILDLSGEAAKYVRSKSKGLNTEPAEIGGRTVERQYLY